MFECFWHVVNPLLNISFNMISLVFDQKWPEREWPSTTWPHGDRGSAILPSRLSISMAAAWPPPLSPLSPLPDTCPNFLGLISTKCSCGFDVGVQSALISLISWPQNYISKFLKTGPDWKARLNPMTWQILASFSWIECKVQFGVWEWVKTYGPWREKV